jgi:epoxyqueuosine reductase
LLLQELKEQVNEFILHSSLNIVSDLGMMRIWDQPLIGIASAYDELWRKLQQPDAVGSQHLLPQEWLPGAQTVISYFLPFTKLIRQTNVAAGLPSTEWLYGRYEGEIFNNALRSFVVDLFTQAGAGALAPGLDKRFAVVNSRSNWSERHVAFVAGLGTFSLNRSMITSLGAAGRFGSVIVDSKLAPTQRLYKNIDEYCIKCGACIARCPVGAITDSGKDNKICARYLNEVLAKYKPRYGCGKCQTAVPCEACNPNRI